MLDHTFPSSIRAVPVAAPAAIAFAGLGTPPTPAVAGTRVPSEVKGSMGDVAVAGAFAPLEPLALVGGLILGALWVIAFAVVARRLLGVRVGFVRTLLAGMVGALANSLVGAALVRRDAQPLAFLTVVLGVQLLVTMLCLVAAEAFVPSGSHPVRELRARLGAHEALLRDRDDRRPPGIANAVDRDLDIVRRLASSIEARRSHGVSVLATIDAGGPRGLNAVELADGFARAIREELDFRVEARNITAVTLAARSRGDEGTVRLPIVHERLSSRRVLVMERLDGLALGEADAVLDTRGIDRHTLACGLLDTLLRQNITNGVFHADPHPGNVLLLPDGRLELLDFGSVGRLDALVRGALQQLLPPSNSATPMPCATRCSNWPSRQRCPMNSV